MTALTSGGAIPDTADYDVVLEPAGQKVGTINEDFAVESLPAVTTEPVAETPAAEATKLGIPNLVSRTP